MGIPGDSPSSGGKDGMKLLQEALEVFGRWKEEGGEESAADLLDRYPHLREYLEPLLEDEEEAEEAPGRMGDFEILGELGRGGMGVVYEARQISLDRKVALKVLSLGPASNPASLARFRREARMAASLDHPGLVKILSFGNEGGTFFLAMELIEGASLAEILEEASRKGLSPLDGKTVGEIVASLCGVEPVEAPPWKGGYVECVLELVRQVAEALDHAHRAGIVHRDVKPSNILVRPDGKAVLTDFGLARERGNPTMTMTGDFVGTPYYVSPEQAKGGEVDGRTDVFSLGATLYELLTLKKPFAGESTHQVLGRILGKEPPDPHKINPGLHPDLSAVVLKALEKDPSRRYPAAGAFAADIQAFLEYRPVSARRPTLASKAKKWVKREPWKASLALLLVLAVPSLGGMGIYLLRKQGEIRLAQEAAKREKLEDLLGIAFLVMEEDPNRAGRLLAEARALDP
ncbi:MAG TPA: serine/threonine protein kinase, partial [Planctomycetes bacterium]|nr:serine/threonine protein kinase [Planctomycetota bacterium]